jgi:hypothetical protein
MESLGADAVGGLPDALKGTGHFLIGGRAAAPLRCPGFAPVKEPDGCFTV